MNWLWVGSGGVIGALLRYQISLWLNSRYDFRYPVPTLIVNLTGSFVLGWFTSSLHAYFPQFGNIPYLFLGIGLCGAYTTFSTFSYEAISLLRERREVTALVYVSISCVGGFAASALGLYGLPK